MLDDIVFAQARSKLIRMSRPKVNDLGYGLRFVQSLEKPLIIASVYGPKTEKMTEKDKLELEVLIPEEIILDNRTYKVEIEYQ